MKPAAVALCAALLGCTTGLYPVRQQGSEWVAVAVEVDRLITVLHPPRLQIYLRGRWVDVSWVRRPDGNVELHTTDGPLEVFKGESGTPAIVVGLVVGRIKKETKGAKDERVGKASEGSERP